MRERDDGEARGHVAARARASGHSQVYQAGANQYLINVQIACDARRRADGLVEALTHAAGEWRARCKELEEQVGRAKAEGRAEARAELAERLREAEVRAMRTRSSLRQAEAARAEAEALLVQARSELARSRRREERDAERRRGSDVLPARPALSLEQRDSEQFSALMDRADSWVGRTGDGYRYDHIFVSRHLARLLLACGYLHEPRVTRLTDHSAMTVELDIAAGPALVVSDPTTAQTMATLF